MKNNTPHNTNPHCIAQTASDKNVPLGDKEMTTYYVRDPQGNVLAVYEKKEDAAGAGQFQLKERHLYGMNRLGMVSQNVTLAQFDNSNVTNGTDPTTPQAGDTHYELTNHLGNVMAVISDKASSTNEPTVVSLSDYYPFGMTMGGRSYSADEYRYGFQGQDRERELWGGEASFFKYRISDNRLGRFFSVDPLSSKFPWNSSYAFSENRLMDAVELEGLEKALIEYGGSRHTSHNNTFQAAAFKYRTYYNQNKKELGIKNVKCIQIANGKDIINAINNSNEKIVRLDIATHMTPFSINTSSEENRNNGVYVESENDRKKRSVEWWYGDGYKFENAVTLSDIDYSKFADNAIVELHGCRAGMFCGPINNIAAEISERLSNAGKEDAVVIAHREPSEPGDDGTYQHGKRVVYWGGRVLLKTTKDGDLTTEIGEALKRAKAIKEALKHVEFDEEAFDLTD